MLEMNYAKFIHYLSFLYKGSRIERDGLIVKAGEVFYTAESIDHAKFIMQKYAFGGF
jgi:hypothetical protein